MNYWDRKEERAEKAKVHTKTMKEKYKNEIKESICKTIKYSPDTIFSKQTYDGLQNHLQIEVIQSDVVDYIINNEFTNKKVAVLNFASYKHPGGKFIDGSSAQEETLCHNSFLYNVLSEFSDYYEWNKKHLNRALYENRALYSPNIIFEREEGAVKCDVLSCAAPNFTASYRYCYTSMQENSQVLKERIKFVLDIFKENQVDVVIIGAFGCGVFGQNPEEVALYFRKFLESKNYNFEKVIFPILKLREKDDTYEKMKKVLIKNSLF